MADTKLSALTELAATPASDDEIYIRDVSEAVVDESKRITITNLIAAATGRATIVRKTADETVNNSDTLQNDDELLLAVAVNEVWTFFMWFVFNSGTTPDFKFTFTVPTNGSLKTIFGGDVAVTTVTTAIAENTGTDVRDVAGVGADRAYLIWGKYVGGDTAGNIQFQWAQNVANASNTIVRANSFMIAHKLG